MYQGLVSSTFNAGKRTGSASNSFVGAIRHVKNQGQGALGSSITEHNPPEGSTIAGGAVKDNISTLQAKTTCASAFLRDYQSPYDAAVVQMIEEANHDIVGKTNMDEFGMGSHSTNSFFGSVRNVAPWQSRSAGGSSGGSAVAVRNGHGTFALGTDTGGSVRLPAAYVGVVGFKPSYGRVSRWGVIPYANSLDTVGIFVSTTLGADTPLESRLNWPMLHELLYNSDLRDPTCLTRPFRDRATYRNPSFDRSIDRWGKSYSKKLRIGIPMEYNIQELSGKVQRVWEHVLETLQQKGHTLVPVSLPSTKHALSAYYVIAAAEAASNLAKYDGVRYGTRGEGSDCGSGALYAEARGRGFGDEVKRRILLGSYTLSSEAIENYFIQAQKVRRLVQRDFDRVFAMSNPLHDPEQFDLSDLDNKIQLENKRGPAQVDVLICPTAPTFPPLQDEAKAQDAVDTYMNDIFTVPASLAGLPAISVPVPLPDHVKNRSGVDFVGIQVIGQFWDDFNVVEVGALVEGLMAVPKEETEIPNFRVRRHMAVAQVWKIPSINPFLVRALRPEPKPWDYGRTRNHPAPLETQDPDGTEETVPRITIRRIPSFTIRRVRARVSKTKGSKRKVIWRSKYRTSRYISTPKRRVGKKAPTSPKRGVKKAPKSLKSSTTRRLKNWTWRALKIPKPRIL